MTFLPIREEFQLMLLLNKKLMMIKLKFYEIVQEENSYEMNDNIDMLLIQLR